MESKTIKKFKEELMQIKAFELTDQDILVQLMELRSLIIDLLNINIRMKKPFVLKTKW